MGIKGEGSCDKNLMRNYFTFISSTKEGNPLTICQECNNKHKQLTSGLKKGKFRH